MAFAIQGRDARCCSVFRRSLPAQTTTAVRICDSGSIGKFHLGNDKTCMSAAINIDFDQQTFARDFVTYLSQSSPDRARPERCELFRA